MIDDELAHRLRTGDLARVADQLLGLVRPTIRVSASRVDETALAVGTSKLGGVPDLPQHMAWPEWEGEPLAFIAQLRLEEVAPFDVEGVLPPTGLLSFFFAAGAMPYSDPDCWAVFYCDDEAAALIRRQPPPTLQADRRFRACALDFAVAPSLPGPEEGVVQSLGLTDAELRAYLDLWFGGPPGYDRHGASAHRLLGYPTNLEGSALVDAYLASSEWYGGELLPQSQWTKGAAQWRLLLQNDSNDEAGMDWEGGGLIYYCIQEEALQAREFGDVWLTMQFL